MFILAAAIASPLGPMYLLAIVILICLLIGASMGK